MRTLDLDKTIEKLVYFIQETTSESGFSRLVLNLSGGIDSATSISLAVKALGAHNVYVLLQPYQNWHQDAVRRSWSLIEQLQIPTNHVSEIDIAPIVRSITSALPSNTQPSTSPEPMDNLDELRLGNIMARIRMIILFDRAKTLNALALGTENKTEHYLGYYTRFGDEASDIEPLRSLYKTEVYQVARSLGLPDDFITTPPTAGLWPGQTDEGEFGFTYQEADEVLHSLYDLHLSAEELVERGISTETVYKVSKWVKQMEFKHHLPHLPPEPIEI